jgi:hypothetical protein
LSFDRNSYPDLKNLIMIPGTIQFVDAQHGWFQWIIQTSAAFSDGVLFSTSDGGASWTELHDLPSAREIRFHTPQDGWIVGNPDDRVEVTHDGGKTWQPRSVPPPTNCRECIATYSAPSFQDPNNGVLLVTYRDFKNVQGRMVHSTYITRDGGNSWQCTDSLERNREDILGAHIFSSVVSDHAIFVSDHTGIRGIHVRGGSGAIADSTLAGLPQGDILNVQFVDDLNGWVKYAHSPCVNKPHPVKAAGPCHGHIAAQLDLLATTDGGNTFAVITPHFSPPTSQ